MKKHIFGKQLQRDTNERKALFKSLMNSLVIHERIQTTESKAKAVKGEIEKVVTKVKKQGEQAERILRAHFSDAVLKKLINEIAPRFAARPGGYTRIIKLGNRLRDNAKMVVLEWVEKGQEKESKIVNQESMEETKNKVEAEAQIQEGEIVKEEKKETKKKAQTKTKSVSPKATAKKTKKKEDKEA